MLSHYILLYLTRLFSLCRFEMVSSPMTASEASITSVYSHYNVNSQFVVTLLNGLTLTHGRFIQSIVSYFQTRFIIQESFLNLISHIFYFIAIVIMGAEFFSCFANYTSPPAKHILLCNLCF